MEVARLAEILGGVRRRKHRYLTRVDPDAAENFINGAAVARFACGFEVPLEARRRAKVERGWTWSAARPIDEMRGRGLTEEAIVDELFAIEIVALETLRPGGLRETAIAKPDLELEARGLVPASAFRLERRPIDPSAGPRWIQDQAPGHQHRLEQIRLAEALAP